MHLLAQGIKQLAQETESWARNQGFTGALPLFSVGPADLGEHLVKVNHNNGTEMYMKSYADRICLQLRNLLQVNLAPLCSMYMLKECLSCFINTFR